MFYTTRWKSTVTAARGYGKYIFPVSVAENEIKKEHLFPTRVLYSEYVTTKVLFLAS